jgi:hypothetical protein
VGFSQTRDLGRGREDTQESTSFLEKRSKKLLLPAEA